LNGLVGVIGIACYYQTGIPKFATEPHPIGRGSVFIARLIGPSLPTTVALAVIESVAPKNAFMIGLTAWKMWQSGRVTIEQLVSFIASLNVIVPVLRAATCLLASAIEVRIILRRITSL
jgi:hypothetical protein